MTDSKLPVLTQATLDSLLEAMSDRDLGALKPDALKDESWAEIMRDENPLLFSRLEQFSQVHPRHVQARILYAGVMVYMTLRAQLASDNNKLNRPS